MTAEKIIFVVDKFYHISGKGTVITGELLNDINVEGNIIIASSKTDFRTTKILNIESNRTGKREETSRASIGESVGIWVDFPKEKIEKGMGLFKENDVLTTSSEEIIEPSHDEMITFINKNIENSVNAKAPELNSQISKYLAILHSKEQDLINLDDYGDYCFDLWWAECEKFIDKKLLILKLEIIHECRRYLKERYDHSFSDEIMEIYDEYMNSKVISQITNKIDELLTDFKE